MPDPFENGIALAVTARCTTAECGPDFIGKVLKALGAVIKPGTKFWGNLTDVQLDLVDSHFKNRGMLIVTWQAVMDFANERITFEQLTRNGLYDVP